MPTKKHRIGVLVDDRTYDVLRALSEVSGSSMSSIVGGLITAVEPALSRTVRLMRAAAEAPEEIRRGLSAAAEKADSRVSPALEDAVRAYEAAMRSLEDAVARDEDPRSVITGVRSTPLHEESTSPTSVQEGR